jgi:predicted dehydrogenase
VREKSGGQLVEQVIHMVDLMRHLMGEPVSVFSRQGNMFHRQIPDYTVEDISATIFTFASGALGIIYATNGAIPNRWINDYHVVTQHITADFTDANHATFHFTGSPDRTPQNIASDENVYHKQLRDLLEAIHSGGETRTPLREGARSLDLALAATHSTETRTEVELQG